MIFWILTLLSVVSVVVFVLSVSLFLRRCPVLRPGVPPTDAPLLSVIVPARNEAANIERCVRSLLAQQYPRIEVIAVDDASTDATPTILERLADEDQRLHVVTARPLRHGWTGKNNAIASGVQHARGDWLLFVDADVALHPGTLSAAYQAARQRGVAMLSLWARQEVLSFWERAIQPVIICFNLVSDPLLRVNRLAQRDAVTANGQFLLAERAAYERVGGHASVRDEVVEDQELCRRFKQAGEPVMMMDGSRVLQTRMYTSLIDIWEGWSKNNFLTFDRNIALVLAAVVAVYFVAVNPFVLALWALVALKFNSMLADPLLINLGLIALLFVARWRLRSFCGTPLRDYWSHPLGTLVFIGIMLNSAFRHTFGLGVTWKGRSYSEAEL